jgi:hypothetical protein
MRPYMALETPTCLLRGTFRTGGARDPTWPRLTRLAHVPPVIMAIQLHVEVAEARQIPLLGIDRVLRLAGHLRAKILLAQRPQTRLPVSGLARQNLMLKIIQGRQGILGYRSSSS